MTPTPPAIAFCLKCGSNCCVHLQKSIRWMLTPRHVSILMALLNPAAGSRNKDIATSLGLTEGTIKVYLSRIYQKLGWTDGSRHKLALWAVIHREQLNLTLPTPEQFKDL